MKKDIVDIVSRRALLNLAIRSAAGAGILAGGFRNTMMAVVEQPVPPPPSRHEMLNYTAETLLPHVGRTLTFEAPCEGEAHSGPCVSSYSSAASRLRQPPRRFSRAVFAGVFRHRGAAVGAGAAPDHT